MKYLIISSHSVLADAYKETASMIAGKNAVSRIQTFCVTESMEPDDFVVKIQEYLSGKNQDDEYLILADLFGASPCNSSIIGFRGKNYRVVTGLNLGMLLEALFAIEDGDNLDVIADTLVETGKNGIQKVYLAG